MARERDEGLTETYAAATRFVDQGLRRDGSLFTPGVAVWTGENVNRLTTRFAGSRDYQAGTFGEKLRKQLSGEADAVVQLAAEMLYVYALGDSTASGIAKRQLVDEVLGWLATAVSIPRDLAGALERGFGAGGTFAHTARPLQLEYLIRFTDRWKGLSEEDRQAALNDPWRMKEHATSVDASASTTYMRCSILYFTHPDAYEPIFSDSHRRGIVTALGSVAPGIEDADQQILAIRKALEARYGPIDFYDSNSVIALWNPGYAPWRAFLYWCGRSMAIPDFPEEEIDYKLEIGARVRLARDAMLGNSEDWRQLLRKAFTTKNNLTSFHMHGPFLDWVDSESAAATEALRALWLDGPDVLDRVAAFLGLFPKSVVSGSGLRATLVSFLLLGEDPHRYPPFKATEYQKAWAITGYKPEQPAESAMYARALDFLDELIERGRQQGVTLPDRLHAQGAMWTVLTLDEKPADWTADEWAGIEKLRALAKPQAPQEEDDVEPPSPTPPADPFPALADDLLIAESALREMAELLEYKGQIIFYGPPGTGKTFVAQRLARTLAGGEDGVRLVQFHPSYAYEDFVEGYRPRVLDNGQPGFHLVDGPLKRIAAQAKADPARIWVLIIDELNRGNVAKVLGELYFLLEYRDKSAELLYSGTPFQLPSNLRIIGTMNTADRSIALMDAALRRRFGFVPFFPDEQPMAGLLERWLRRTNSPVPWMADVLDELNRRLGDRNSSIGPSYFMRGALDQAKVERIWRHEIRPQLEELFFDQPAQVAGLSLEVLRAAVKGTSAVVELSQGEGTEVDGSPDAG